MNEVILFHFLFYTHSRFLTDSLSLSSLSPPSVSVCLSVCLSLCVSISVHDIQHPMFSTGCGSQELLAHCSIICNSSFFFKAKFL